MNKLILGIHHITALASDAQANVDFYAGILGLRMVKKTVNFDAPEVYHLYYANETGSPGTIMTFFPYPGMPKGRKGKGQVTKVAFSIPEDSVAYWLQRLEKFKVTHQLQSDGIISLEDSDGLGLELVANNQDQRPGFSYGNIPVTHAIKGFYSATLSVESYQKTADLLTHEMDHDIVWQRGERFRYSASGKVGDCIDLVCCPDALSGIGGAGTVHHIAFITPNAETQKEARDKLVKSGVHATPIMDREYFKSVYFREPGGILFEIATVPPGFTVDEDEAHLGEALKLPPWQEPNRAVIERNLSRIQLDQLRFQD